MPGSLLTLAASGGILRILSLTHTSQPLLTQVEARTCAVALLF